jgi:hypothetical protein
MEGKDFLWFFRGTLNERIAWGFSGSQKAKRLQNVSLLIHPLANQFATELLNLSSPTRQKILIKVKNF